MGTPYQAAARDYFNAGWSPIPLPHQAKDPPPNKPDRFTGVPGVYVDKQQLESWLRPKARCSAGNLSYAPGNVALRLPRNVIGIDVDAYGEKTGEATLEDAEAAWGALPPTWVASSRSDGVSGIRLFRIPEGLSWPGELPQGKGVELLRWDHRYAIVAPSVHPSGAEYRWWREEDDPREGRVMEVVEGEFPAPEELPELPAAWVEGLTSGAKWKERNVDEDMDASELQSWLAARVAPDTPCTHVRSTVTKYTREVRQASDDGGAHDSARDGAWAILGDAKAGHSGVVKALAELRSVFLAAVRGRRADEGAAKSEWARIVLRGAAKVSAEGDPEEADPCVSLKAPKSAGSKVLTWRLDDIGNADRLIRVMDDRARYVEGYNSWVLWDGARWRVDDDRQVERWAVKAVDNMAGELEFIDEGDSKARAAFRAHMKSSGGIGRLRAMVDVAKGRRGIIVPASTFDTDARLLACPNGVVVLGESGVEFREAVREDYLTLSTGTEYKPGARSRLWDEFLKKFQPDEEIRTWLQKLVGYSLLGSNPKRLLIIAYGPTSTGKTTFADALRVSLGGYAAESNLSIFRDNQDERSRPDLVEALPKRAVFIEEVSSHWHLHPDQIKRLLGGAPIRARLPYAKSYVEMQPAFTPWLMTNSAPTIQGADAAVWRRLLLVPFSHQIAVRAEKSDYKDRLAGSAREAILAWAVRGYEMWVDSVVRGADDVTDIPAGALMANAQFRDDLSDVDAFLAEVCVREAEATIRPDMLLQAYELWCDRNSIPARDRLSGTKLARELTGKDMPLQLVWKEGRPIRFRAGVRLNPDWENLLR